MTTMRVIMVLLMLQLHDALIDQTTNYLRPLFVVGSLLHHVESMLPLLSVVERGPLLSVVADPYQIIHEMIA
jgi:hypothetical protein